QMSIASLARILGRLPRTRHPAATRWRCVASDVGGSRSGAHGGTAPCTRAAGTRRATWLPSSAACVRGRRSAGLAAGPPAERGSRAPAAFAGALAAAACGERRRGRPRAPGRAGRAPPSLPRALAAAGRRLGSSASAFGSRYAWDGAGALEDAPSQMLSLCLRLRGQARALTAPLLGDLWGIWRRQTLPDTLDRPAWRRQRFTALLLRHLLESWGTFKVFTPQHAAARVRSIDELVMAVQEGFEREPAGTITHHAPRCARERWRCANSPALLQFIQQEIRRAEQHLLGISPLKHVLTRHDRSSFLAGLWLEFGVAEGRSLGLIAAHVPAIIAGGVSVVGGKCFGFDSFEGLPEDWRPGFRAGHFETEMHRPPSFAAAVEGHVALVEGLFEDTLSGFLLEHPEPVAFLHLDSDLYSSCIFVLEKLIQHGRIREGTVIVFDELFNYCGFENHEILALFEVVSLCGLEYRWLGVQQKGRMQAALVVTGVRAPVDIEAVLAVPDWKCAGRVPRSIDRGWAVGGPCRKDVPGSGGGGAESGAGLLGGRPCVPRAGGLLHHCRDEVAPVAGAARVLPQVAEGVSSVLAPVRGIRGSSSRSSHSARIRAGGGGGA
ncbi:unnamed protein product, partial [Prorocentrum cordatum]